MFKQDKITRPSVKSQLIANVEAKQWTDANNLNHIIDFDGISWNIDILSKEKVITPDIHESLFEMRVKISSIVDLATLTEKGVLNRATDQRIISFIGENKINFTYKTFTFRGSSLKIAQNKMKTSLNDLKQLLENTSTRDQKRKLIFEWIDKQCQFNQ